MSDLDIALATIGARQAQYQKYARYYAGDHPLMFATDKFLSAFGPLFHALADNLCPCIVDAVADRLSITGFVPTPAPDAPPPPPRRVPGLAKAAPPDPLSQAAWALWQGNRMARRAGELHMEALKSGDAYLIVWPDLAGVPQLVPQPAAQMMVVYAEEQPGVLLWAAKAWAQTDGHVRLTLYYPDRLERYITRTNPHGTLPQKGGDLIPFAPVVPNSWNRVPVFHFAANAGVGAPGRSELTDVIPLQDALNKALCDMIVGMEFNAFPQRWLTGYRAELDEITGRPLAPVVPGADRIWAIEDGQAKFGEFPAAGLDNYLRVQDNLRLEIARVSRTPLHYMALTTGQRAPSGEALRIAETPLVQKVKDRMLSFGDTWGDALTLALTMAGTPGAVIPDWVDPTPHSELEHAQELQLQQAMGVPEPVLWLALGYTPEEVDAMMQLKADAAKEAAALTQPPVAAAPAPNGRPKA